MVSVTVPGGSGGHGEPLNFGEVIDVALQIAIEVEVDLYRKARQAYHAFQRKGDAELAAAHDEAVRAWTEAARQRDAHEASRK